MKRPIVEIDRDKCNGCGLCTTACAEGALILDDYNKAVLVKDIYCDGLGACLDVCPVGALKVTEKEAEAYDSEKTYEHVKDIRGEKLAWEVHGVEKGKAKEGGKLPCGCPSSLEREIVRNEVPADVVNGTAHTSSRPRSELTQWPIQLHLVSSANPAFNKADILIAADCTAFSLGSFHQNLLKGKKLVIACPKLDDVSGYIDKLTDIIKNNVIYSITVAIMSVPCCSGLMRIVEEAVEKAGKDIAIKKVVIGIEGDLK